MDDGAPRQRAQANPPEQHHIKEMAGPLRVREKDDAPQPLVTGAGFGLTDRHALEKSRQLADAQVSRGDQGRGKRGHFRASTRLSLQRDECSDSCGERSRPHRLSRGMELDGRRLVRETHGGDTGVHYTTEPAAVVEAP